MKRSKNALKKQLIHQSFPQQAQAQPAHMGSQSPAPLSILDNQLTGPSPLNLPVSNATPTQAITEEG